MKKKISLGLQVAQRGVELDCEVSQLLGAGFEDYDDAVGA